MSYGVVKKNAKEVSRLNGLMIVEKIVNYVVQ